MSYSKQIPSEHLDEQLRLAQNEIIIQVMNLLEDRKSFVEEIRYCQGTYSGTIASVLVQHNKREDIFGDYIYDMFKWRVGDNHSNIMLYDFHPYNNEGRLLDVALHYVIYVNNSEEIVVDFSNPLYLKLKECVNNRRRKLALQNKQNRIDMLSNILDSFSKSDN